MSNWIRFISINLFLVLILAQTAMSRPHGGVSQCVAQARDEVLIAELEQRGYNVTSNESEVEVFVARIATCEVGEDLTYPGDDAGGTVTLWNRVRNSLGTVVINEENGTFSGSRYLSDNTKTCVDHLTAQPFEIPPSFVVECRCSAREDYPQMANLKVNVRSSDYATFIFRDQLIASFGSSSYLSDNQRYCNEAKAKVPYCSRR